MKLYRSIICCILSIHTLYGEDTNLTNSDKNIISSNLIKDENKPPPNKDLDFSITSISQLIKKQGYFYYGTGFTSSLYHDCEPVGTINIGYRIKKQSPSDKRLIFDICTQLSFKKKLIYDYIEQYPLKFTMIQYLSQSKKSSLYIGESLSFVYFCPNCDNTNNWKYNIFEGLVYGLRLGYQMGMQSEHKSSIDLDINWINPKLYLADDLLNKINNPYHLKKETYTISLVYNTAF